MQHHLNQSGELERILVLIHMPGGLQVLSLGLDQKFGLLACFLTTVDLCVQIHECTV